MARPIWKGSISFGLVNIPVSLFPAESRRELAFHMLDGRDMSPIHNLRVSERTGEEVPFEEIVKGYEYEPGKYVLLGDEDFRRANVKATQTIDIEDFVKESEIEPMYYDKPYYLAPTKAGTKGYALLREALEKSDYVGVAKIVIRTRQHLAAVVARGPLLALEVLRFAYEIRDPSELELPPQDLGDVGASKKELDMAEQLIGQMVEAWDPTKYKDSYHDDLMALIRNKVEAGELAAAAPAPQAAEAPEGAEVIDIMSLLKKSVEEAATKEKKGAAPPRRKAKRAVSAG